jgi:hypothetical protein
MAGLYRNYISNLAKRFVANLESIETGHNFDYGPEFEIVLCDTLRSALPDRIGVARGFVVGMDNSTAGDDIILFDRSRFPTLAMRERDNFSRKEFVPAEAVLCYAEAKHTLQFKQVRSWLAKRDHDLTLFVRHGKQWVCGGLQAGQ